MHGAWKQIPATRYQCPVPGAMSLVPSTLCQVPGASSQEPGARCLVPCAWCQVPGAWRQVPGAWRQESGARYQVSGVRCQVPGAPCTCTWSGLCRSPGLHWPGVPGTPARRAALPDGMRVRIITKKELLFLLASLTLYRETCPVCPPPPHQVPVIPGGQVQVQMQVQVQVQVRVC